MVSQPSLLGEQTSELPRYPIESVDNALRLLLLFGDQPRIRLTDASAYLGVASSTAHRLLAMLTYRGFVRQAPDSHAYIPGPALSSVAYSILSRLDVRSRARPVLAKLLAQFDETVHFARLDGSSAHFLEALESSRAVRVGARMGRELPANTTSTGKALLSLLSDTEIEALYPTHDLARMTEHTITVWDDLMRSIQEVREEGYSHSDEESEDLVAGVAVPLPRVGNVCYAISVAMPTTRMTPDRRLEIVPALTEAAGELSNLLL